MSEELKDIKVEDFGEDEVEEDNSKGSEDTSRSEEKWDERKERYFKNIKQDCLHKSDIHSIISHKNKKRYMLASIPATIIPLILVNIDIFTPQKEIQMAGLTLVSIINGVNTLYNFSKKCEVHNTYSGKYADLASEIDKILIRKKKYRQAFDVLLEKITNKKRQIDDSAPQT
jgi:hypothetical protein